MLKRLLKNVLCFMFYVSIISSVFCYIFFKVNSVEKANTKEHYTVQLNKSGSNPDIKAASHSDGKSLADNNPVKDGYNKCLEIYNNNKELLVLVNRNNPLPTGYSPSLKYICNGRLEASSKLYDSLVRMLADAKLQGYNYWIASAYRSQEKQQKLVDEDVYTCMVHGMSYDDALKEVYKETMPAGCSEHQTGLALDILCSGNSIMDASQKDEPGNKWLRKNCYKYGFILRYPEDKSNITGINFEPWHFRYVGKEAAKFIMKSGITLEEFYMAMEQ